MPLPSNPPATTTPTALKTWMQNTVDTVTDHESRVDALEAGYTATGEIVAPDFKATGKTGATTSPGILAGGTNTGAAPTTGAHVVGEVVVGHDGNLWVCTSAGTPGTWTLRGDRTVLDGWFQDNVAASQTAVALVIANARTEIPMVTAGSVVGIVVYSNAARSAGTLTVDVTINGTATGCQAVLDGTNTQTDTGTQAVGTDTFTAGQRIGVKITTDGSWSPTTADIDVAVLVSLT